MSTQSNVDEHIENAVIASAVAGCAGTLLIGSDMVALYAIWANMIHSIAQEYDVEFNAKGFIKYSASSMLAAAAWIGGSKVLNFFLMLTGLGAIGAVVSNCIVNGIFTYRIGRAMDEVFKDEGCKESFIVISKRVAAALLPMPGLKEIKLIYGMIKGHITE